MPDPADVVFWQLLFLGALLLFGALTFGLRWLWFHRKLKRSTVERMWTIEERWRR